MATITITGTINGVNNAALANKWITFRLVQLGTDSAATATVAQSVDSVQTDANGDFSIDVWNNGDSGKPSVLEITVDGSKAENVIIPTGTASIELWDLIENYQADGSTSEQVPVVSDFFLRKSNNLSDLSSDATSRTNLDVPSNAEAVLVANNLSELTATSATARANLGVVIGTDVQAHSAILDATTASFTTADETKLDGIEALADVTDATNIVAAGGYIAGGTDVALTDGGTGASDAPTARTNLGVAIGSDVQAHSAILDATTASFTTADEVKLDGVEALADVTDSTSILAAGGYIAGTTVVPIADGGTGATTAAAARAALGVPATSEGLAATNNLSDLGDVIAARTNLGLGTSATTESSEYATSAQGTAADNAIPTSGIGFTVQAYNAVLSATTASYTLAEETKLSGIEDFADVTSEANIAANNGYVVGGNDVALTDGGTGASDAPTARANLGFRDNVSSAVTAVGVTSYTVLSTDEILTVDDTAIGGNVTINLPSAATLGSGWSLTVKRTGITYLVTIDPDGTETIDGALTLPLTAKDEAISIVSDGTNWEIVGSQSSKLDSVIYVKEASDLSGVLVSDKVYQIDGIIDMGSQSIEVPTGGLSLIGSTFDVCQLTSSAAGYTMFTSPVGGSGNLLGKDLAFEASGAGSQVFDLVSATGFDAFEFARINFNNCSSLGTVDNYRQGLEDGSGRFGGSPSLTLKGAWLGGYRITTSIVRGLAGTMTAPLFSAGTGFVMQSRFLTDINCDLPTLAAFCDFSPTNLPNPNTLQIQGAIITRDGASDANDANITPNILESDLSSAWKNNIGVKNTFVGGQNNLAVEVLTTINTINVEEDLAGTWIASGLQHFDDPSNGHLRHLGNNPKQYQVTFDFVLEGTASETYEIRLIKDDGVGETLQFSQQRVINNLQGGRDVGYFGGIAYVNMNQNDSVYWKVVNTSSAANCTLEDGSQFNVSAR